MVEGQCRAFCQWRNPAVRVPIQWAIGVSTAAIVWVIASIAAKYILRATGIWVDQLCSESACVFSYHCIIPGLILCATIVMLIVIVCGSAFAMASCCTTCRHQWNHAGRLAAIDATQECPSEEVL